MSIWNKILIGFIFVAAVAFTYFGARALKTHQYWREIALKHEAQLRQEKERHEVLINGTESEPGIRQAMLDLHEQLVDRGRVWRGVTPQRVEASQDEKTGQPVVALTVQMDTPDPHLIEKDANLVIFEEKDIQEKGQYLGRFTVEAVAGKQVQLKPCMRMTQREVQRLQASRDKWCMYEIMPIDNHTVFANCDELDKLIPQSSLDEYVKDGQPTDPNNPEAEKFQRKLRDYSVLFTAYHQAHSVWLQKMEAANRDKGYVEAGLAQAKREVEECQKDIADLKGELAQINRERDAVAAHRTAVEAKLAEIRQAVAQTLAQNRQLASSIARIQLEATRQIDARTQKMAQINVAH
jgi:hypothetical protein